MTDETAKQILPGDVQGYREIFESCASLIAVSRHPRLAATLLLNASLQVALEILGREKLERDLRDAIGNLEMSEAAARGRLT